MEHLYDLPERSKFYLRQLKSAKKYEAPDKLRYGYITVTSAYLSVPQLFGGRNIPLLGKHHL